MYKVLLVGNPNVGKSTLFNSLTKSNEHTGNFHGVTVEEKHKIIELENEKYEIVDLPGMYSLNSYSYEEEVSKNILINSNSINLSLVDANCIRKNLYLCLELLELGLQQKILINNYDYFIKNKNKLNVKKLSEKLNIDIEIINAKKIKISKNLLKFTKQHAILPKYLEKYIKIVKNQYNLPTDVIIRALNGIFENLDEKVVKFIKNLYPQLIQDRYKYLDEILLDCVELNKNFIYGYSKLDKLILNPIISIICFFIVFFISIYANFFLIGKFFSEILINLFEFLIINPFMNFLYMTTDNVWLIEFFQQGIFSAICTVFSFLPQVCILFVFLTILEDSGIIARLAYVFDDFLSKVGLNGKAIYIMLMGLGCNTMSTMASRNMGDKNMKLKTAILNPYISCMARLPIYIIVASAFFGQFSYLVVVGLYLLGLVVAIIMSLILSKTILPTKDNKLLLEFTPLRGVDIKHVTVVAKQNAVDMFKRIFGVVLCVGIIVWILTHTMFNLQYTDTMSESILFLIADKISFILSPLGLNSAGIVCALIVGVMAKELIVSTMSICNNTTSNSILISSLSNATSVISFSPASAISFLIFSLLYCPCVSNLAVLNKECGKFYTIFVILSQLTIAFMLSFIVYQALTRGFVYTLIAILVIGIILASIIFIVRMVTKRKCFGCKKCKF